MKCKVCGGKTRKFLDLGKQPIANRLLERPEAEEPMYSLILRFCEDCFIVQLEEIVEDTEMFDDDYPFCTSSSAYMVLHFNNLAKTIKNRFLERNESICEIGSNDGTFLRNFKDYNHVGVEPSSGVASKSNGLNVINQFFNERLAEEIVSESGQMDVIVSANVFPHVFDRKDFLRGIRALLKPEGVWINEEAYLDSILSRLSYDQFYCEHIYTSSLASFKNTVQLCGLELVDYERQWVHGGSMRYFTMNRSAAYEKRSLGLDVVLNAVKDEGLFNFDKLKHFSHAVKTDADAFVRRLKEVDGPVVGYGATAKSSTILNYCNIGPDLIQKIYDTTPEKQGKYTPGTHIPIVSYEDFDKDNPKNVVLFAWNHMEEILKKEEGKNINWITPIGGS